MHILKGTRARKLAANGRRLWLYLQRKTCFGNVPSSSTSSSYCNSPVPAPTIPSTSLFASFDGIQAAADTSIDLSRSCTAETETLSTSSSRRSCSSPDGASLCRLPKAYDLVRTLNGDLGHFLTPIHLVRQRRSGKLFIIKQVELSTDNEDDDDDDDDDENWPIEASLLADLAHSNIIALESVHIDRDCSGEVEQRLCNIVLPYCNGGDVHDFIESRQSAVGEKVPLPFMLHFASSMIDALSYLHQGVTYDADSDQLHRESSHPSIIHRDIKPKNIFLDRSRPAENGLPTVVLADFGLATTAANNRLVCGTAAYFAPEVSKCQCLFEKYNCTMPPAVREKLVNEPIMSTANDWWAFGCCLYELMTGRPYTYTHTPCADADTGADADADADADVDAQAGITNVLELLLYQCLRPNPYLRPQAMDVNLHRVSAIFKARLREWHDAGGRLEEDFWPEPFLFEKAKYEASFCGPSSSAGSGNGQAAVGAQSSRGNEKDCGSRT